MKGFHEIPKTLEKIEGIKFVKGRKTRPAQNVPFRKRDKLRWLKSSSVVVCFLWALLLITPIVSAANVGNVEEISANGEWMDVISSKTYCYSDANHEMDIDVPQILDPQHSKAADQVNQEINRFTAELADQFYKELDAFGEKSHHAIFLDYDVLMNHKNWFTLRLTVNSVNGSSDKYYKIYHIDRNKERIVTLSDLFCTPEFKQVIQQDIMEQMKEQIKENNLRSYFIDEETMWEISDKQNFYFNENGDLVILFDKYEVAPGAMGTPEFIIDKATFNDILKSEVDCR